MFSIAVGDASPNVCKQNNFGTAQIMYTANMNKLLISKDTILHFCDEKNHRLSIDLGIPTWSTCDTQKQALPRQWRQIPIWPEQFVLWVGTDQTIPIRMQTKNSWEVNRTFQKYSKS